MPICAAAPPREHNSKTEGLTPPPRSCQAHPPQELILAAKTHGTLDIPPPFLSSRVLVLFVHSLAHSLTPLTNHRENLERRVTSQ